VWLRTCGTTLRIDAARIDIAQIDHGQYAARLLR
jgi:hypothetical protein